MSYSATPSTLPKEYTIAIKGILSLFIVGTHLCATCAPGEASLWLQLCSALTPLALAFFFFFSGFGLMTQLRLQEARQGGALTKYWSGWLRKRLWGLVKPFLFFFVLAHLLTIVAQGVDTFTWGALGERLLASWSGLRYGVIGPPYPAWFLGELFFLYIFFFLAFRWGVKRWIALLLLVGQTLALILFASRAEFGGYWLRYPLCFAVGVGFALWEQPIYGFMKRYLALSIPMLLLGMVSYVLGIVAPGLQARFFIDTYQASLFLLPILLMTLAKALGLTNLFLAHQQGKMGRSLLLLGDISLEVYLLHMSFVELFHSPVLYIHSVWGYTLATYGATLLGAYLIARYLRPLVRG
ncbi:acyltransferase family protein [Porphyromonas catoniae]|jgi:membrane protein|uniref:Acyltransferase n=2 Tax=Porphyromonas catoniae TaxID=41976 RepID=Z4WSL7_9PORP|nr:acyltransferase family protein [Porphyromonas catoniae]EWC92546.1 acyltransferase [Porphyromonas catoniae ATCC 51270]